MGINSFWLFYIEEDSVLVALINWGNGRYYVASIGPKINCDINNRQSILTAADESLSSAATSADIDPEQEPIFVGLVIPSSWVGEDGKIVKPKSDIIMPLLKTLDLKPSGFMSNDEAIIEESNKPDDFPASFINLYLENNSFELSLIYLGKIKRRIRKYFDGEFNAQLVEDALVEFNSDSTLPPQIYVYGKADEATVENLKNFPWVGKKNVETFLHFPDIKLYSDHDLINIFFKAVTSQMIGGGNPSHQQVPTIKPEEEVVEMDDTVETEEIKNEEKNIDSIDNQDIENIESLTEVSFEDLGFSKNQPEPELVEMPVPETIIPQPQIQVNQEIPQEKPQKNPIKFNLPKINFKLPKLKGNFLYLVFPVILLVLTIPLIIAKTNITLFITPYEFDKTVNIKLDSDANDLSSSTIPVDKKTVTIDSSVTIKTTGQKTVGTKASGEVTIFNKLEKVQSIPKGSVLIDSKDRKFELMNSVQIASSSSNFDTGTMNFGQVKTVITASDIGPDFNITKDTALRFKDFPETTIVVKSNTDFTGGTKNQISAVSQQDKINVESQLNQKIQAAANERINGEFNNSNDVIKETIQTKKGKMDLNREIDEETDDLTATAQSTVSVLAFKSDLKNEILKQFLSQEKGFSESELNPNNFTFSFNINKIDQTSATGSLTIKGRSLPKIDTDLLKKNISGRSTKKAGDIIKKTISRVYDFNIQTSFKIFDILPFNTKNIFIDIKNESQ